MNKQTLISSSKLVFVIIAFANTACEMNIASNNQVNGNQVASNNLNGLASPGGLGALPAAVNNNGVPVLPQSVENNIAAEQNRVRHVISTMAVQNNPFAEVTAAEAHQGRSTVVASYQPATAEPAAPLLGGRVQASPPTAAAETAARSPASTAPLTAAGGGTATR